MKDNVKLQQLPRLLELIRGYREKIKVNSSNLAGLTAFVEEISDDKNAGSDIKQALVKLDTTLAEYENFYVDKIESVIAKGRTGFNLRNDGRCLPFSKWINETLEADTQAFDHIIASLEHRVDHRFPALNLDSHSSMLTVSISPSDPGYLICKFEETLENYNEGLLNSLKKYRINARLIEVSSKLPQEQFNLLLSTQNFTSMPTTMLSNYLVQCFKLLRPGGSFIIAFTDVQSESGFEMLTSWADTNTEPGINCLTKNYFLEYILKPVHDRAPYIIEDCQTFYAHTVTILKKPGQLKTTKNRKVVFSVKAATDL